MNKFSILIITFTWFLLHGLSTNAQTTQWQFIVVDSLSGEAISDESGVLINEEGKQIIEFKTNEIGHFVLDLSSYEQKYIMQISGYWDAEIILLPGRQSQKIKLFKDEKSHQLKEVVVTGMAPQLSKNNSSHLIDIQTLKSIPALGGEIDVMKALTLLPGTQFGKEGMSNITVRGGAPDQNLIYLDDVPVYNVNHFFGFFSVFPSEALKRVEYYKAGFDAKYGGRLSSVIDIKLREGNSNNFKGYFNIGLLSAQAGLEGPIIKNKSSFILSARRTYFDLFPKVYNLFTGKNDAMKSSWAYYFYDVTFKANYILSDKTRLFLSTYTGLDKYSVNSQTKTENQDTVTTLHSNNGLKWGNLTTTLRMQNMVKSNLMGNTVLSFSRYRFSNLMKLDMTQKNSIDHQSYNYNIGFGSGVNDYSVKSDWSYFINKNALKFGGQISFRNFYPRVEYQIIDSSNAIGLDKNYNLIERSNEYTVYSSYDANFKDKTFLTIGSRFSYYIQGAYKVFMPEPRLNFTHLIDSSNSVKLFVSRMSQPLHLLANSGVGLATDLWVPATQKNPIENSWQYSIAFNHQFKNDFVFTVEGYYKSMQNVLDYKDGASYLGSFSDTWQDKVSSGQGKAYGVETMLEKKTGKLHGWITYTWSKSLRQFDDIYSGAWFAYKYDRRNSVNVFLAADVTKRSSLSISFQYLTGSRYTLPEYKSQIPTGFNSGAVIIQNAFNEGFYSPFVFYASSRNNMKMRDYHRMDLGYEIRRKTKYGERIVSFNIYNVYGRRNPFYVYTKLIGYSGGSAENVTANLYEKSYFTFIPAITLKYIFD